MKIEVGKTYKTRDGRKARVICVDRLGPHDTVVALVRGSAYENVICYPPEGFYDSTEESPEDLVEEWREPLEVWGLVSPHGFAVHLGASRRSAECWLQNYPGSRLVKLVEVSE